MLKRMLNFLFASSDLLANSRQKALRELLALSELPAKPQPNATKEEVAA